MRKWVIIITLAAMIGCSKEKTDTYLTHEKALWYFTEIESVCNKDNGKLWGTNLYGPIMFVDRTTRKITANRPDAEDLLKLKDGVYTGIFPREQIIDNIAINFGGTLFAMAPLPPDEDTIRIKTRAIHGLFHCFQRVSGIEPSRFTTRMMDEKSSRLWLKLEWKALRNAISEDGEKRIRYIRDALIFRGARRELNSHEINDENKFECYEGLSTLTFTLFCHDSEAELRKNLIETLDRFYRFQSYSRSYGFIHGALYAYLAYEKEFDFRTFRNDSLDLAGLVKDIYEIQLPEICRDVAGSLALGYDIESINKEEEQRLFDIKERMHRQVDVFTQKPVVFFELESPYFDFEPEDIRSLDTLGTIYNSIRVSDNWGKLTVEKGGCLVSYDLKTMRITARNFKESKNHLYGDGWHLLMNSDWQIIKSEDNYFVRKLMP